MEKSPNLFGHQRFVKKPQVLKSKPPQRFGGHKPSLEDLHQNWRIMECSSLMVDFGSLKAHNVGRDRWQNNLN